MKKFLFLILSLASLPLFGDIDLRVQNFAKAVNGTADVVSTGWKNYGLKVVASAEKDATVEFKQMFTFYAGKVYEISGDFSGSGKLFVELHFFNNDNTPYKVPMKRADAVIDGDDFEVKFDLREFPANDAPRRFKVVFGVAKGGSVLLEDIEMDMDND